MVSNKTITSNERTHFCERTTKSILFSASFLCKCTRVVIQRVLFVHIIVYSAQHCFLTEVMAIFVDSNASERNDQKLTLVLSPFLMHDDK